MAVVLRRGIVATPIMTAAVTIDVAATATIDVAATSMAATAVGVTAASMSAATTVGVTAPIVTATAHMATAMTAAVATTTAVTDQRDWISAWHGAGGFQATEAGPGGLLAHGRDDKAAHERRDRNCNQNSSHDVLSIVSVLGAKARYAASQARIGQ